ncbi:hypothetical protein [Deinococcus depolymerans]|uniref:Lipoprotein n=1 Tax=Deinococcus depolymerans TaxID=392408 RepID=A0ABN1CKF1_9DEIO
MNASLPALLAGLILAAGLSCASRPTPDSAQGGGSVIFPPAAGTAVFSGPAGTDVAQAAVTASGHYGLTLPPGPPLPAAAPTLLDLLGPALPEGMAATCQGTLTTDPPTARLLVLSGGRYLIGSQVTGTLRPAPQAIGTQQVQVTTRQFVYSDRAATLGSAHPCSFTRGGLTVPGVLRVRPTLRRGWTVLETRLELGPDRLNADVTDAATGATVDWLYRPRSD